RGARRNIGAVEVAGTPRVTTPAFLRRLHLVGGAPYEPQALTDRINAYVNDRRQHGYYEAKVLPSVRIDQADHLANVTLSVDEGPRVRVVFAGDSLPAD